MARIAFVLADDFEDAEFETPYRVLRDHGHDVTVVGVESSVELTGKRGNVSVTTDVGVDHADVDAFDALVVPGGYSPDKLRTDDRIVDFVAGLAARRVPVAAICHAGSLLIEADLVSGRTLTSWPSIRTDLVNAGADWVDDEVVVDGNLITSRKPDDLDAFTKTLLAALE